MRAHLWVILNANLIQWGEEVWQSEADAIQEIKTFFGWSEARVKSSKFTICQLDNLPSTAKLKPSTKALIATNGEKK